MCESSNRTLEGLLTLAREGNQHLGQLLNAHCSYLTMLARLRITEELRGKVDASDLVQETFLAAHQNFVSFRGTTEAEFLVWLRRILASRISTSIKHFGQAKRRDIHLEQQLDEELERESEIANNLAATQTSPSEHAVLRERAVLLADALEALPPHYREVILLRDFQGLSFPDAARQLGRTADAVRKLWVRALAELHKLLAEKLAETS